MADQPAVSGRPTGTVTMLFTDIEGSTRLLQRLGPDAYGRVLGDHHRLIRDSVSARRGVEIKTEGDSFFVVFHSAIDALCAAAEAQRALAAAPWPEGVAVHVRMGVHTGDVQISEGEYLGVDVHRAARIAAAAHGDQVLVSAVTRSVAEPELPDGYSMRDLGEHMLKDFDVPEHLYQLDVAGLRGDFPAPRAVPTRFDLLPAEVSSFVGRTAELARAGELLGETRLLTLTGPGGTGKTRLAIQLARARAADFADGVAFVPLAPISDPNLVPSTIRTTLGIGEQQGQSAMGTLKQKLAGRHVLLVIDNFEQVTDAAPVLAELLEALPALKVIVTSRVALRITGEQEFAVPPLSVPVPSDADDLGRLTESDAVALFVQRARAVRADFAVTAENARSIVDICARLDGLPLAIELAASRIKLLPPQALLERLSNRLDFLQSNAADRTDRQRTLRGAIDWSYNLLSEPERALFRRMSIFVGGWRLEEGDHVAAASGGLDVDLFDGIAALVDHSLIRRLDDSPEVRFGMLETIRDYGREQLDTAGESAATGDAHADCFADLAASAEPHITADAEWPDRLEREHANIRAAIRWLAENDTDRGLVMCGRLWRFWHLRGHLREGTRITQTALDNPGAKARTFGRAKALIGLAGLLYWQLQYEPARRHYEEALAIARDIGDKTLEVETLYSLAYVRDIEGDYERAIKDFEDAQLLYESQGNELMAVWSLGSIGMTETLRGRHDVAVEMLDRTIGAFERLRDGFGIRNATAVKLRALMHLNRLKDARTLNRDVLRLSAQEHDITSFSASLLDAASLFALTGDYERAALVTGAAQRIVEESGGQPPPELVNRIDAMPALKAHLDANHLNHLISDGRALSQEAATELALAD
jgi:predicted ATPase/class 3 adenylate cyclase